MGRVVDGDVFRRLVRAREAIHDRLDQPLRVAELARVAGMSRFHFLRRFQDVFGATPHQYLIGARLERARDLLARRWSVTDTCLEVGFSSLGSFSASFARRVGRSPSAFRRAVSAFVAGGLDLAPLRIPFCFASFFAISEKRPASLSG